MAAGAAKKMLCALDQWPANGCHRNSIEMMAKEFRYEPLLSEIRTVIIAAWKRGGMLLASVVEEMVPAMQGAPFQLSDAQTSPHHG